MITPLTPLEFLDRAVRLFGSKVGVVDGARRFTYADLGERVGRLAGTLSAMGLQRGERVGVMAWNSHPLLEAYFGVPAAGGVLLPLNVRLAGRELARIVEHSGTSVLLVDGELAGLLARIEPRLARRPRVVWIGERPADRDEPLYEDLLAAADADTTPAFGARTVDENAVAELFYTSGTTGRPRGVMLTHRNLYLHALSFMVTFRASERDVQLHTIPLFHVNGWGTPQAITGIGGRHVMLRRFDPGEALRLIEAERVTRVLAVPTMLTMLLGHPECARFDTSSLELINTGGAPTPPDLIRRAEDAFGCPVIGGYGLTETSPIITFAAPRSYRPEPDEESRILRQSATGMPLVGVDLAIVDDSDRELPWDGRSVGEIVVRGNVVTAGYWDDADATAEALRGGALHTGDLATIDPEGNVRIVDRKKDIIISGGENISSIAVEAALHDHPAVRECAVLGVPDPHWGEVPRAFVVLEEGAEADPDELIAWCRTRLAGFQVPKSVVIMDELPKGGTGKVLKRALRAP